MESIKQRIARFLYPFILWVGKNGRNGTVLTNMQRVKPSQPFHLQNAILSNGEKLSFSALEGKKILVVNTASGCGYTGQYAELQTLHERFGDKLTIIAFPANDFKQQETADNSGIAQFCQLNYGVTFLLAQKAVVIKGEAQNPVFKWLTHSSANGWNNHAPDWNFSKYLIDETGTLTHYFGPSISPLEDVLLNALNQ